MTDHTSGSLKELQDLDLVLEGTRTRLTGFDPLLAEVEEPAEAVRGEHRIAAELAAKLRSSNLSIREYLLFSKPVVEDGTAVLGDLPSDRAGATLQRGKLPGRSETSEQPPIDAPDPA